MKKQNIKTGFTVIELLISIVIIGILSSIGYKQYTSAIDKAKAKKVIEMIKKTDSVIAEYYSLHGQNPTALDDGGEMEQLMIEKGFKKSNAGFMVDLGPRSVLKLKTDSSYIEFGGSGITSVFKYITVKNVPSSMAEKIYRELNGKKPIDDTDIAKTVNCGLISLNNKIAISKVDAENTDTIGTSATDHTCISYTNLTSTSGSNNVNLFYPYYKAVNAGGNGSAGQTW
jgi:prepilin-type N-terminal cleavage/methylation domain-containing protein